MITCNCRCQKDPSCWKYTKLGFNVHKKNCDALNSTEFSRNLVYGNKCNFTDFDTISALQINCYNKHRVDLPYGFAAFDYQ